MAKEDRKVKKPDTVKEWFSEREASTYTGIPVESLKRLRYNRDITYRVNRDGKRIAYSRKDLDEAMERNYVTYTATPEDHNKNRFK